MDDSGMRFNLLIIGDEILNGRRQDRHLANAIRLLQARGLSLSRSQIVGDDPALIGKAIRDWRTAQDIVFVCGGIGATPDDLTRQSAAEAFGVPLEVHPEGLQILRARFGDTLNEHRIYLVTFPRGARLIPNPYNQIPGFSLGRFHFMPGFPQMAEPMMAWVLDNEYPQLQPVDKPLRKTLQIVGKHEGELVDLMNTLLEKYPDIKLSCLPRIDKKEKCVELSVSGEAAMVEQAFRFLTEDLQRHDIKWEILDG